MWSRSSVGGIPGRGGDPRNGSGAGAPGAGDGVPSQGVGNDRSRAAGGNGVGAGPSSFASGVYGGAVVLHPSAHMQQPQTPVVWSYTGSPPPQQQAQPIAPRPPTTGWVPPDSGPGSLNHMAMGGYVPGVGVSGALTASNAAHGSQAVSGWTPPPPPQAKPQPTVQEITSAANSWRFGQHNGSAGNAGGGSSIGGAGDPGGKTLAAAGGNISSDRGSLVSAPRHQEPRTASTRGDTASTELRGAASGSDKGDRSGGCAGRASGGEPSGNSQQDGSKRGTVCGEVQLHNTNAHASTSGQVGQTGGSGSGSGSSGAGVSDGGTVGRNPEYAREKEERSNPDGRATVDGRSRGEDAGVDSLDNREEQSASKEDRETEGPGSRDTEERMEAIAEREREKSHVESESSAAVRQKKKPVATRSGGRNRKASARFQEFKEVELLRKSSRRSSDLGNTKQRAGDHMDSDEVQSELQQGQQQHQAQRRGSPPHSGSGMDSPSSSVSPRAGSDHIGASRGASGDGWRHSTGDVSVSAVKRPGGSGMQGKRGGSVGTGGSSGGGKLSTGGGAKGSGKSGGSGNASGGGTLGDIAAAALAARRNKKIDTVVLAKCRRKSQTMWPARLCSKREMLERMANPDPADEGVDRRYQCLVVFLCEGGHHVTDWVTPNAIRPYLRHAAAYPYKKKAYAGNARLQPDFAAAEAWGEQLKAFVAEQRRKEKVARRALRAEQRAALAQAKYEQLDSVPASAGSNTGDTESLVESGEAGAASSVGKAPVVKMEARAAEKDDGMASMDVEHEERNELASSSTVDQVGDAMTAGGDVPGSKSSSAADAPSGASPVPVMPTSAAGDEDNALSKASTVPVASETSAAVTGHPLSRENSKQVSLGKGATSSASVNPPSSSVGSAVGSATAAASPDGAPTSAVMSAGERLNDEVADVSANSNGSDEGAINGHGGAAAGVLTGSVTEQRDGAERLTGCKRSAECSPGVIGGSLGAMTAIHGLGIKEADVGRGIVDELHHPAKRPALIDSIPRSQQGGGAGSELPSYHPGLGVMPSRFGMNIPASAPVLMPGTTTGPIATPIAIASVNAMSSGAGKQPLVPGATCQLDSMPPNSGYMGGLSQEPSGDARNAGLGLGVPPMAGSRETLIGNPSVAAGIGVGVGVGGPVRGIDFHDGVSHGGVTGYLQPGTLSVNVNVAAPSNLYGIDARGQGQIQGQVQGQDQLQSQDQTRAAAVAGSIGVKTDASSSANPPQGIREATIVASSTLNGASLPSGAGERLASGWTVTDVRQQSLVVPASNSWRRGQGTKMSGGGGAAVSQVAAARKVPKGAMVDVSSQSVSQKGVLGGGAEVNHGVRDGRGNASNVPVVTSSSAAARILSALTASRMVGKEVREPIPIAPHQPQQQQQQQQQQQLRPSQNAPQQDIQRHSRERPPPPQVLPIGATTNPPPPPPRMQNHFQGWQGPDSIAAVNALSATAVATSSSSPDPIDVTATGTTLAEIAPKPTFMDGFNGHDRNVVHGGNGNHVGADGISGTVDVVGTSAAVQGTSNAGTNAANARLSSGGNEYVFGTGTPKVKIEKLPRGGIAGTGAGDGTINTGGGAVGAPETGYDGIGGFSTYKYPMPQAGTGIPPYARGFHFPTWQEGSGTNPPPHHPYPGGFTGFRYPQLPPQTGYPFSHHPSPFFSGYPSTTAGSYPPHHIGRPGTFPPVFGAGLSFPGGNSGTGGRSFHEGRTQVDGGGFGPVAADRDTGGESSNRGRPTGGDGAAGQRANADDQARNSAYSTHPGVAGYPGADLPPYLGNSAPGATSGGAFGPGGDTRLNGPAAVAAAAAAAAAAATRPDWGHPWTDSWRLGSASGAPRATSPSPSSAAGGDTGGDPGDLPIHEPPHPIGPGDGFQVEGETAGKTGQGSDHSGARGAMSHMLEEDPSERRRRCDSNGCDQMATHGFILPRLCGVHREERMKRIVPPDVESGSEWGSEAESDARDFGRFRRIRDEDDETIRHAIKLYPPRNPKIRERVIRELLQERGFGFNTWCSSGNGNGNSGGGGGGGSSKNSGASGSGSRRTRDGPNNSGEGNSNNNGGESNRNSGSNSGTSNNGGISKGKGGRSSAPSSGNNNGTSANRAVSATGVNAGGSSNGPSSASALATASSASGRATGMGSGGGGAGASGNPSSGGTGTPRPRKTDQAIVSKQGVRKPKGKHPGYIVTLYGKKVRRCGQCAACQASDCGQCRFCKDMPKHGGRGSYKQPCEARKCVWVEYDRRVKTLLASTAANTPRCSPGASPRPNRGRGANDPHGERPSSGGGRGPGAAARSPKTPAGSGGGAGAFRPALSSQGKPKSRKAGKGRGGATLSVKPVPMQRIPLRARRCGKCGGCLARECRKCKYCKDMTKYGGPGRIRQVCINKRCINLERGPPKQSARPADVESDKSSEDFGRGDGEEDEEDGDDEGDSEETGDEYAEDGSVILHSGRGDGEEDEDDENGDFDADEDDLVDDDEEEEERGRQELDGDEAGADVGSGEASSEGDSDSDVNQEVEQADPDFALMHSFNYRALEVDSEVLECPWLCTGCLRRSTSCGCPEGFPSWVDSDIGQARTSQLGRYNCFNTQEKCSFCCRGAGHLIMLAEWARDMQADSQGGAMTNSRPTSATSQDKHGQHGADRAGNARVAKASGAHSKRPRDRPLDESDGGDQEAVGSRDGDLYDRGYRFRMANGRKRGRPTREEEARSLAADRSSNAVGRTVGTGSMMRTSLGASTGNAVNSSGNDVGNGANGGSHAGGVGTRGQSRGSGSVGRAWGAGDVVEIQLAFTGRQFLRLKLDNAAYASAFPVGSGSSKSAKALAASSAAAAAAAAATAATSRYSGRKDSAAAAATAAATAAALASGFSSQSNLSLAGGESSKDGRIDEKGGEAASNGGGAAATGSSLALVGSKTTASNPALSSGTSLASFPKGVALGSARWIFAPTPLVGPKPGLARGGWVTTTAAPAFDDDTDGYDEDGVGGVGWEARIGVKHPLFVLWCLRRLLVPNFSSTCGSDAVGDVAADGKTSDGEDCARLLKLGGKSALAGFLVDGLATVPSSHETSGARAGADRMNENTAFTNAGSASALDYSESMRKEPIEQLVGKIRLLVCADLASSLPPVVVGSCTSTVDLDGATGGPSRATSDGVIEVIKAEPLELGLGEFISLLEDVHRSVERTTRQSYDSLMQVRQARREDGLGRLKERLRKLESKRGSHSAALDRFKRRISAKTERLKTLKALEAECKGEIEKSMAPESMDFLELMIRKERNHLARFKTRVREVEAKMLENDAMLSSAKEDKVRRLADADRREREAEGAFLKQEKEKALAASFAATAAGDGSNSSTSSGSVSGSSATPAAGIGAPAEASASNMQASSSGVGGEAAAGGVIQPSDMDSARLVIRARKLDLAAREWVAVRGLLLKRATSRAAQARKPESVNSGGMAQNGHGSDKVESVDTLEAMSTSRVFILRPTVSAKGGGGVQFAPVLDGVETLVDASSGLRAGVVMETKEEACTSYGDHVGRGWGGWGAGSDEQQYLAQAHTQDYLEAMSSRGRDEWGPALSSAACVVRGVSAVLSGKCSRALCLVETPGRYASSGVGLSRNGNGGPSSGGAKGAGPCFVNNIAVGALYAHLQWSVGRIAVVDFDSHLATGTADILCRTLDPAFLYATMAPTGGPGEANGTPAFEHALRLLEGSPSRRRNSNNTPIENRLQLTRKALEGGGGSDEGEKGAVAVLASALEVFRPDLVMISAGLDGRLGHACGRGDLVAQDYEWLTKQVVRIAERLSGGRVVSVHERKCAIAEQDAVEPRKQRPVAKDATSQRETRSSHDASMAHDNDKSSTSDGKLLSLHMGSSKRRVSSKDSDVADGTHDVSGGVSHSTVQDNPVRSDGVDAEGETLDRVLRSEGVSGMGAKGKGKARSREGDRSSGELDCLKAHVRGLSSVTV